MLENIRQISILNKIFNLNGHEWPRVIMAWFFRFFYRVGFVVGWTVIVGMFVSDYGIKALPYLFVVNAVFTILGSIFYAYVLDRFKKLNIIFFTIGLSVLLLLAAIYLNSLSEVLFFALLLLAEAVFLTQLKVLLDGYIEEMFNPLESERTFPLIEASETVGGISAGLIVVALSGQVHIVDFIYFWVGVLILIVPFMMVYDHFFRKKIKVVRKKIRKRSFDLFAKIKKEFSNKKHISFIKGMILIVFFQWFLFNLLEFQYTKAVYQNVSGLVLDAGSGFEHALVHDLGELFVLFSGSALLIQLFIGSRLINSLGVMGSMLLHPIVTLLSLFGLSARFTFPTAVLAKNNFTITTVIFTNAYHSSYYAIKERLREHTREFMEGIIRPLGAIGGTFAVIVLQRFFVNNSMILSVNLLMLVISIVLFIIMYLEQSRYSDLVVEDLLHSKSKEERANAVDILSQKGHKSSSDALRKVLLNEKESVSLRVKILYAYGQLKNVDAIADILKCLESPSTAIREAALNSLLLYKCLGKSIRKYLYLEYKVLKSLEKLYRQEIREEIRLKVVELLSRLSPVTALSFLLDVIHNSNGNVKASAIFTLSNFKDPQIVAILRPFLNSKNPKYKINAAIALGKLKAMSEDVLYVLYSYLHSENTSYIALGLFAVGELRMKKQKKFCFKFLHSKNIKLRMQAAIALAKLGQRESIPVIVELLMKQNTDVSKTLKRMLRNVDVRISQNIDRIVKHLVVSEVNELVENSEVESLEQMEYESLINLKKLYCLVEEYDEVENINNFIKK